ncbi:MAG: hypothetical protein R3C68_17390 [Myxococcota bacterium]
MLRTSHIIVLAAAFAAGCAATLTPLTSESLALRFTDTLEPPLDWTLTNVL